MGLAAAERIACEELAMVPGTEFAAVHRFIPPPHEPRLLALEALFRSVRDVPLAVSDPSVGMAKLGWWHKELSEAPERGSQHPVVRALLSSGALEQLEPDELTAYLHALMLRLQEESVSSSAELERILLATAGCEARLLCDAGGSSAPFEHAAAAARLLELARGLSRTQVQHDWLPLDLVARHGVKRSPGGEAAGAERAALVQDLLEMAERWRREQPLFLDRANGAGEAFLILRDGLVRHRLKQAQKQPQKFLAVTQRGNFGEVFAAWNTGRRLQFAGGWELT